MGAVNLKNIFVGAPEQTTTGAISSAPLGTALPTDAIIALNASFTSSGYVTDEGLKLGTNRGMTAIKDWSGSVVRQLLDEYNNTLAWGHLELNADSLKNYLGDANVTVTAATASTGTRLAGKFNSDEAPIKAWAFNMKDGVRRVRVVAPIAQVTERGEITFAKSSAITLPVTLTTYPDASGNHIYLYTDDGVFTA